MVCMTELDFPGGSDSKASAYSAGDPVSIPGGEDPLEKEMTEFEFPAANYKITLRN